MILFKLIEDGPAKITPYNQILKELFPDYGADNIWILLAHLSHIVPINLQLLSLSFTKSFSSFYLLNPSLQPLICASVPQ